MCEKCGIDNELFVFKAAMEALNVEAKYAALAASKFKAGEEEEDAKVAHIGTMLTLAIVIERHFNGQSREYREAFQQNVVAGAAMLNDAEKEAERQEAEEAARKPSDSAKLH